MWAEFNVYERDAAFIKPNDDVQITTNHGDGMTAAKVNFIQPFFNNGENFMNIRVYLANTSNNFRVGQLVEGSFATSSTSSNWIPASARLDLGTKEVAFIKRRGVFRPTTIVTGRQSGTWLEVVSGLVAKDSVAYNAQFMVDSESFIKVRN